MNNKITVTIELEATEDNLRRILGLPKDTPKLSQAGEPAKAEKTATKTEASAKASEEKPAKAEKTPAKAEKAVEDTPPAIALADVQAAVQELIRAGKLKFVQEVLKKFGASSISNTNPLAADKYAEFLAEIKK